MPAGQQCAAPTDAVTMEITRAGLNAHAQINNKSDLPATCNYTATKARGIGPQTVTRDNINVGAHSDSTITDMLWPPPGDSYNAVVKCTATYNGKQTSIGEVSLPVNG